MSSWEYAPTVGEYRSQALLNAPSFDIITERIVKEMQIVCVHCDQCRNHPDFCRVIFCIKVCPDLFDLFYNSPNGYRGAYFDSSFKGLEANSAFIAHLEPFLTDWADQKRANIDIEFAKQSLRTPSAKVWLAEKGKGIHCCAHCKGEFDAPQDCEPERSNKRWECVSGPYSNWGRKAPRLTKLRIFGAFLDSQYDEFVAYDKRYRAREIHERGWS